MTDEKTRRRWINLGELIALAALVVSAFGVWIAWKSSSEDKPTRIVEQKSVVPLTLRGMPSGDGRTITIVPAESSHALESLTIVFKGGSSVELGSDGRLSASDVEKAFTGGAIEPKDVAQRAPLRIDARYVESGRDRRGGGNYVLRYKWEGGGLFGGRSLRLLSLTRG